jgi:hypothetical protein
MIHVLCAGDSTAQTAAAPKPVKVFVDVTAKDGSPSGLDASKLTVSIDGKQAQVLSARPAKDDTLLFAVMVDISGSGADQAKTIDDAAIKVLQALTHEGSLGYLVLFNTQTYPTKRPILPSEADSLLKKINFYGGTSLYDSVAEVASGILASSANPNTPRRLIILISDGDDNYSKMSFDVMRRTVQREGISIFMLSQWSTDDDPRPSAIKRLTADVGRSTGGKTIANKSSHDVDKIIAAIQGQTELTLMPSQLTDGELHALSVETAEKNLSISAPEHIAIH